MNKLLVFLVIAAFAQPVAGNELHPEIPLLDEAGNKVVGPATAVHRCRR